MSEIFERVRKVIAAQGKLNEAEVTPDAHFYDDLGLDSLEVELIMAAEEEFGIEIPDRDAERIVTPGELARYIDARLSRQE